MKVDVCSEFLQTVLARISLALAPSPHRSWSLTYTGTAAHLGTRVPQESIRIADEAYCHEQLTASNRHRAHGELLKQQGRSEIVEVFFSTVIIFLYWPWTHSIKMQHEVTYFNEM